MLSTNRYSLANCYQLIGIPSANLITPAIGRENSQKSLQTEDPGTGLPPKSYRENVGVTDQTRNVRTTCSVTFQRRPQTVPNSEQPSKKKGLNCEELRDRYTGPPRGTAKELGPEGHGKMWGSRPSHMLENTLFRGVFSDHWHLHQVAQT
jgi:hypothetical protein